MAVVYPQVEETLKRSLETVLQPYFLGGTFVVSGTTEHFYKAELDYDINKVNENVKQNPKIVFTGSRSTAKDYKVNDPKFLKVFGGMERQQDCTRTVFVSIPKSLSLRIPPYTTSTLRQSSWRDADRIWGQLLLLCKGLRNTWAVHNMHAVDLEATPRQLADPDFLILSGAMTFQLRYEFTR